MTCDSCLSITRLVAGFLGQEDKRVEAVEFLASDFCINGVPEGDMEFCDVSVTSVTCNIESHVTCYRDMCGP